MKINIKKLIIPFSILTGIIFIFSLFINQVPKIVSSTPINGGTIGSIDSPITIAFDRQVNFQDFAFTLVPEEQLETTFQNDKSISLKTIKPLRYKTAYSLNIKYKTKSLSVISFTTTVPPNTQFDARLIDDVVTQRNTQFPLLLKTPYENSNYKIYYISPLTIEIKIKNSDLSAGEVLEEVKSWVTQNGGDVSSHKFTIATP